MICSFSCVAIGFVQMTNMVEKVEMVEAVEFSTISTFSTTSTLNYKCTKSIAVEYSFPKMNPCEPSSFI